MKRFVLMSCAALMTVFVSPAVWAQATTAPATQPGDRDGRSPFRSAGERRFDGFGGAGGPRPRSEWRRGDARPDPMGGAGVPQEVSEEEWAEIKSFMKAHSPKRLERLEEDIADEKRQLAVRHMMAIRYREMEEMKERDPELYQIRLARMPVEDAVFALGWELTHGKGDKSEELRADLRKQVRLRVQSRLAERAHRLKQFEKRLDQERRGLKAAEENLDAMVESHMAEIQDDRWPRELRLPPPPRRDRRSDDDASDVDESATE